MKKSAAKTTESQSAAYEAQIGLRIKGIRPLLLHNGRLSNPLDLYAKAVAQISKKKNKTAEDHMQLALREARGGMYETTDGLLGLPVENVWRCIWDASKAFRLGELVKRALLHSAEIVPIFVGGRTFRCDEYLLDGGHPRFLHVPVKVNGRRTMRARAEIDAGWEIAVTLTLLTDVLEVDRLRPVLDRAARLEGLGDWRPVYGTFEYEIV